MKKAAVVVGGVAWNLTVEVPRLPKDLTTLHATSYREGIGGTGAGKAMHLARLGIESRLHTLIGEDAAGVMAREALGAAGVDLSAAIDGAETERHLDLMDPRGDRLRILLNPSTESPDVTAEELERLTDGADLVLLSLTAHSRRMLPLLREAAAPVWVDLDEWDGEPSDFHRPFIEAATHVFLSDMELDNPLRTAEELVSGKELVVLTHGKRGATAFFPDTEPFFVPPHDAGPLVNRDGAEDAFCAGVAYGRLHGWGWPRALHAGAVVAGGCVAVAEAADPALTPEWLASRL